MSTTTRRGFFRALLGAAEPPKPGFSLARFYAERSQRGETTGTKIPTFSVTEPKPLPERKVSS